MFWLKFSFLLFLVFYTKAEDAEDPAGPQDLTKRRPTNRNFFTGTNWYKGMGWCRHRGSQLLIGDFNGDGKSDMLCHDNRGRKWIAYANARGVFTGTNWYKNMGWCWHAGSQLLLGDFNGDGRTDMLCHDNRGRKWIAYATRWGRFTGSNWYKAMGWCWHRGSRLLIGDFNGDRRDDMLCNDKRGNYWVSFAQRNGRFRSTSWHKRLRWCTHRGSVLHVGDFNRDKRDDLLCNDRAGSNWVMLASRSGQFNGRSNWAGGRHKWCSIAAGRLYLADFNGDKRADMLCHRPRDGYKWIALAHRNIRRLFTGTSWHRGMRWCVGSTVKLYVGDFNGDGKADMLCHGQRTGQKWISFNQYHMHYHPGRHFRKINRSPVCFGARGNHPGIFRYYGPSRIVEGLLLVHRSGAVSCHSPNRRSYSPWGCGGTELNVVVTDQYNYVIYPNKKYVVHRNYWYRLPGKHSKHSSSIFLADAATPFHLTRPTQIRIWYGEDLVNRSEGDNGGRACVDVYAWFGS